MIIQDIREGEFATAVFTSMEGDQLLPIDPRNLNQGGLFINKSTGLYVLYKAQTATPATLQIIAIHKVAEYEKVIDHAVGFIKKVREETHAS